MPEKRKPESELKHGEPFPAKRARQQVSYDDLDDTQNSNQAEATRSNNNVEENEIDASDGEYGEANWVNTGKHNNTTNKQNTQRRHNQHPRVDPVFGQRSAFPGLDDEDSDELLYGPPENGLEYLRLVRSEAKSLPALFTAPTRPEPEPEPDDINDMDEVLEQTEIGRTSQRQDEIEPVPSEPGFIFIDGVVIATSTGEEDKVVDDEPTRDAQTSYYDLLKHRFILLRMTLRCAPPPAAIASLDDAHPITLPYDVSAARTAWRELLFTSEPQMAQLACMDMETVLGILRLLGSVMIKCVKDNDSSQLRRIGAWAWGLLGRCRDVGELGSEEVGELRVFGRKAANILNRLNRKKPPLIRHAVAEYHSDIKVSGVDEETMDIQKEEPSQMQETAAAETEAGGLNGESAMLTVENVEADEQQANTDLETAKFRLRARLFSDDEEIEIQESEEEKAERVRRNTSSPLGASPSEEKGDDEACERYTISKSPLPQGAEAGRDQASIFLDMIITIVGEFYGQKDLLQQRDVWE
ncbi:hypothetical protein UA08_04254 [Talaromyces atroroseus]|uniref:Uncharacterized protein n=1 Tax=Talaromyces atroroseus TaxID=1441469 RepID=A0A1Q5Q9A8_TALAT|nr:hypothetical protein UA08_04254 [Talaromyces atroroseus]OKL60704.1 hypothetical protein UA08_04254 [Talaromyces atroroseus]